MDVAFSDDGTPAWASGTSEASAVVSAVIASMRAYSPGLTATQAADCVSSTAVNGGNLDAAAAFRACDLGAVVSQGLAAYQAAMNAALKPSSPSAAPAPGPAVHLGSSQVTSHTPGTSRLAPWAARPRVLSVQFRTGRLVVRVASVPRAARVRVDVQRELPHGLFRVVARGTTTTRIATVAVGGWDRLAVVFLKGNRRSHIAYVSRSKRAGVAIASNRTRVAGHQSD